MASIVLFVVATQAVIFKNLFNSVLDVRERFGACDGFQIALDRAFDAPGIGEAQAVNIAQFPLCIGESMLNETLALFGEMRGLFRLRLLFAESLRWRGAVVAARWRGRRAA